MSKSVGSSFLCAIICLTQLPATGVAAEAERSFEPPCASTVWWADSGARHSDFDFWVGEWMVFDRQSGRLNGIDIIEKDLGGCAIKQRWRHMNDDYSLRGAGWRMQGTSSSGIAADGLWHQQWLDNNGGYLMMVGKLNAQGEMVMESDWLEFTDRGGQRHSSSIAGTGSHWLMEVSTIGAFSGADCLKWVNGRSTSISSIARSRWGVRCCNGMIRPSPDRDDDSAAPACHARVVPGPVAGDGGGSA